METSRTITRRTRKYGVKMGRGTTECQELSEKELELRQARGRSFLCRPQIAGFILELFFSNSLWVCVFVLLCSQGARSFVALKETGRGSTWFLLGFPGVCWRRPGMGHFAYLFVWLHFLGSVPFLLFQGKQQEHGHSWGPLKAGHTQFVGFSTNWLGPCYEHQCRPPRLRQIFFRGFSKWFSEEGTLQIGGLPFFFKDQWVPKSDPQFWDISNAFLLFPFTQPKSGLLRNLF